MDKIDSQSVKYSASGNDIDNDKAVWLLDLAVVLLAITRIAEMKDNDD